MRDIYISPIKAVLHCTDDPALDFIFCTSEDYLSEPLPSNVLRLDFRDTVDVNDPAAFSAQLAADIASFLQRPDARPELFVCCDCGVSRSAALVAAMLHMDGGDDLPIWRDPNYIPNPLVYRLMCEALGLRVSEQELKERMNLNAAAQRAAFSHSENQ